VDAQFGGLDQRKIFVLAEESLPKHLGYTKRIHFMNPMVPGLDGGKGNKAAGESKEVEKMSSSGNSKIDLLDSPEIVAAKIGSKLILLSRFCFFLFILQLCQCVSINPSIQSIVAYAAPGEVAGNGLLAFIRMVLFTVHNEFKVEREAKFGGTIVFKTYAVLPHFLFFLH
jgi:tyrosyl-tRNA synthetase